jgi:predicted N-acyltransferase
MDQVVTWDAAITVRWLSRIDEIDAADWDALFRAGNPFLRHAFLSSLENSGSADAESGWRPRHLVLTRKGAPVAAMPLYLKAHSYGEFVFDWGWAEAWSRHGLAYYPKLLTAVPFCPSVGPRVGLAEGENCGEIVARLWSALKTDMEKRNLSSWHLLFADAPTRSPWLSVEDSPLLERRDVQFHFLNPGFEHFDDFLASLRSKRRKNVRKERRRVTAQGVHLERQVGAEISDADWEAFYRCYVSTFLKRSGHGGYLTREFFTLLRERMPEQLMLVVARQAGQVIAGALFLFDRERLYGRWWGALGHVDCLHFETCFYQGIEFAIERGLSVFDPGTQGEHKLLRGFEPVKTCSLHYIRDPRFRAAIADFLERERDHVEAYGENAAELLPFRRDQSVSE